MASTGTGSGGPTQGPAPSTTVVHPKHDTKAIQSIIDGLEEWCKEEDITARESDSAILAIGKLKGAIVKLNRE